MVDAALHGDPKHQSDPNGPGEPGRIRDLGDRGALRLPLRVYLVWFAALNLWAVTFLGPWLVHELGESTYPLPNWALRPRYFWSAALGSLAPLALGVCWSRPGASIRQWAHSQPLLNGLWLVAFPLGLVVASWPLRSMKQVLTEPGSAPWMVGEASWWNARPETLHPWITLFPWVMYLGLVLYWRVGLAQIVPGGTPPHPRSTQLTWPQRMAGWSRWSGAVVVAALLGLVHLGGPAAYARVWGDAAVEAYQLSTLVAFALGSGSWWLGPRLQGRWICAGKDVPWGVSLATLVVSLLVLALSIVAWIRWMT